MKKIFIIILILLLFFSCKIELPEETVRTVVTEEEVIEHLQTYLYEKYNEDFVVVKTGRAQVIYYFLTMPKRYIGTHKEKDGYYNRSIHVELQVNIYGERMREYRDEWAGVFINEDITEQLLPPLQIIFGEKLRLLTVIRRSEYSKFPEFIGDLNGKIFIFDRIENIENLADYREKIFKYSDYLKENIYFHGVNLGIYILDERILAPSYDKEIKGKLIELGEKHTSYQEFAIEREELMSQLDAEYEKMSDLEKEEAIYNFKFNHLYNYFRHKHISFPMLYHTAIYRNDVSHPFDSYAPIYNRPEDIILYNSMDVYYEEIKAREEYKTPWKR